MRPDHHFSHSQSRCFASTEASKIFPLSITHADCEASPSKHCTDHPMETGVIFLYTISGEGILRQRGKTIPLPPDSCCLIDCGEKYSYEALSLRETWLYHRLCFDGSGLLSYVPHLLPEPRCLYPQQPERILEICRFFLQDLPEDEIFFASKACLLLQELLNSLLESLLYPEAPAKEKRSMEKNPLSPAFGYIRKHYAKPITVEDLAQSCHLSKYYFLHLFKEFCGETPYQYLSRYRIDIAKGLLTEKNIPLHSVAAMVGYPTYANFLTQFKKYVNTPPGSSGKIFPVKHANILPILSYKAAKNSRIIRLVFL